MVVLCSSSDKNKMLEANWGLALLEDFKTHWGLLLA